MTKELEALNWLKNVLIGQTYEFLREPINDRLYSLETALKEKEKQDNVLKVLKEVIEFATILPHIEPNKDNGFDVMSGVGINIQRDIENKERELLRQWILETCFPKELKALEIIKEKVMPLLNVDLIKRFKIYPVEDKEIEINEKEYDLLREVLEDE